MKKQTKNFIDLVYDISQEPTAKDIVERSIKKSKNYLNMKASEDNEMTDRQILLMYKDDLMHRWNFLADAEYEGKINLKKVDFWEVMEYFGSQENKGE